MRIALSLPVTLAALLAASPALAVNCKDDIATVERRLNSAGAEQVTGKEPPGGPTSSNSPKALDKPPEGAPSDPSTKPTKPVSRRRASCSPRPRSRTRPVRRPPARTP